MAQIFALTSREREQFFLAAINISDDSLHHSHHDAAKVKEELFRRLAEVQLPAYIIDHFCDIVATNLAVAQLLEIEAAGLDLSNLSQPNMLDFVFSPPAVAYYQPRMRASWPNYAYQNMMFFRTTTLQYRTTDRYQEIFARLWQYPTFQDYWLNAPHQERDFFTNNEYIQFRSTHWGEMQFFSTSFTALTTGGKLYFYTYDPASPRTAQAFVDLMAQGGNQVWHKS